MGLQTPGSPSSSVWGTQHSGVNATSPPEKEERATCYPQGGYSRGRGPQKSLPMVLESEVTQVKRGSDVWGGVQRPLVEGTGAGWAPGRGRGALCPEQTAHGRGREAIQNWSPKQEALGTLPTAREGMCRAGWSPTSQNPCFHSKLGELVLAEASGRGPRSPWRLRGQWGSAGARRRLPSPWISPWRPHMTGDTRVAQPVSPCPAGGTS